MDGNGRYGFDQWVFDAASGELSGPDGRFRLAPQPALVLGLLLEHAGELVTRDFLHKRIWPDRIVDFDKNLNFCIRQVRAALGDRASSPVFIESLPRRGYRFKLPVRVLESPHAHGVHPASQRSRHKAMIVAALGGLALVAAGAVVLNGGGTAQSGPPERAREAAEMGGYLLTRRQGDDLERSIEFFREAIAISPDYGRAFAGLGSAYLELARVEEGKRALLRSLELDPQQWLPHLRLALRAQYVEYEWAAAAGHFRAALERAPDQVVVQHTYAWHRAVSGDPNGALNHMGKALELDPVSPRVNGDVGRLFYLTGHYEEAIAQCKRTLEITPDRLQAEICIISALVEKNAALEARQEAMKVLRLRDAPPDVVSAVGGGDPGEGLAAFWRWAANELAEHAARGQGSYVHAAAAWMRAGEPERALQQLDSALAVHCPVLLQIDLDPAFEPLRSEPGFLQLRQRIGLPGSPRSPDDGHRP